MVLPCAAAETVAVLCCCVSWFTAGVVQKAGSITQLKAVFPMVFNNKVTCPVLLLRPLLCSVTVAVLLQMLCRRLAALRS
jgi:hypothetical protein